MIKNLILGAATLVLVVITIGMAEKSSSIFQGVQESTDIKLKPEELPKPIKKRLLSDAYNDWSVSTVILVKEKSEYYRVELVNGENIKIVKFNMEGEKLENK